MLTKAKSERHEAMSFKVTKTTRRLIELLAAHATQRSGYHCKSDIIEKAVAELAKAEGVKV